MVKDNKLIETGYVLEQLPNNQYKLQMLDGREVRAYLAGKMKKHHINVLVGDKVKFVVDKLGPNNRIIERL